MSQSRQLAAIMFTDIEGYTAIMQRNEAEAIRIRDRHRKIFQSCNRKFNGRILQYYGDGTLSIFNSAIEAVECAIQIQMDLQQEPVIPVRIGIHIGDVMFNREEIVGDSVNVASRIESIAVAGSVFISKGVQEEIKNHPSIRANLMGNFEFKNLETPIKVYAITNKGLVVPDPNQLTGKLKDDFRNKKATFSMHKLSTLAVGLLILFFVVAIGFVITTRLSRQKNPSVLEKSVAVLPFENMSQDPEQNYFSDGITEEIIAHLSKVADLRVVSRTSTKQYKNTTKTIPQIGIELGVATVLEGSVRKFGKQVRITAQLIDAQTDHHLWTVTYDRDVEKIFDIQSEVATEIVRVLQAVLTPEEQQYMAKAVTSEIYAYDYYLKGKAALQKAGTRKDYNEAAQYFKQAILADSGFSAAYAGLAEAVTSTRYYGVSEKIWRDSALALNQKALLLDPDLDQGHYLQGMFYLSNGQMDLAKKCFERVLRLNPNHGPAKVEMGGILIEYDQLEEGVELVIEGLLLELDRQDPRYYLMWGYIYRQIGEFEKAKKFFEHALKLKPDYIQAYEQLFEVELHQKTYHQGLIYAEKMMQLEKNVFSLDRLAWAHLLLGEYHEAERVWQELGGLVAQFEDQYYAVPYKHRLAYVMWQNGKVEEASKLFEEQISQDMEILEGDMKTNIEGQAYDLAAVHAFLGHREEALKWIDQASKKGFFSAELIDRDPLFDPIRGDSQFNQIIAREKQKDKETRPLFQYARQRVTDLENNGILRL